jgi:hypothetical protein
MECILKEYKKSGGKRMELAQGNQFVSLSGGVSLTG